MKTESVLVLGDYRQTLTVARSLARAGYRVIVGSEDEHVFTRYSRAVAERWRYPDPAKSEPAFLEALSSILAQRPDIRWIFPVGETQLIAIVHHAEQLSTAVGVVISTPAVVPVCLDKPRLYVAAAACHVPSAPLRVVTDYAALSAALETLGYPCVVKPSSAFFSVHDRKALILHCSNDLARQLPEWPEGNAALIVQRYASGWRHNCHFLAHDGKLLAYFEQQVLRTDCQDGTGYGVDGISVVPSESLRRYCEQLLTHLNYSGAGCVQWLVNARDGSASLLEINPRLDATCAIPYYCGYDFPLMALNYARYRRGELTAPPRNDAPYLAGRRGVWFVGDLKGLLTAARHGRVGMQGAMVWWWRAVRAFLSADMHLTWSRADPLPALFMAVRLVLSPLQALLRRR